MFVMIVTYNNLCCIFNFVLAEAFKINAFCVKNEIEDIIFFKRMNGKSVIILIFRETSSETLLKWTLDSIDNNIFLH